MIAALLLTVLCSCSPNGPAEGPYEKADRLMVYEQLREVTPPPPVMPEFSGANDARACLGAVPLLQHWSPGWNVDLMSRIMWRESNCQPGADNSCCTGLFQINKTWISRAGMCGVYSRADLYDPVKNICTATIIYRTQGMEAWAQTR